MKSLAAVLGCVIAVGSGGCCKVFDGDRGDDPGPIPLPVVTTASPGKTTTTSTVAPTATPKPDKPGEGVYPLSSIRTIPDNCSKAHVLMATAPVNPRNDYPWTWTRQAVIVHPEFKANGGSHPTVPGEVHFEMYDYGNDGKAKALLAHCADGDTCNRLAAMYRAVVPSSRPQVMCGEVPNLKGSPVRVLIPQPGVGNDDGLPTSADIVAQCARIGVCRIHTDPSTPGDPGIECQKAPSKFKLSCASRTPCSAVVSCLQ